MKILHMGNSLTILLLLVSLPLAINVAYALNRLISLERQGSVAAGKAPVPEFIDLDLKQSRFVPPTKSALHEILERPLFSEERAPPEVSVETAKTETIAKPANLLLQLEGIVITPDKRIVLVRDLTSDEFIKLPEGMEIKGWLMEGVNPQRALFKRGDQNKELVFELKNSQNKRLKSSVPYRKPARKKLNVMR